MPCEGLEIVDMGGAKFGVRASRITGFAIGVACCICVILWNTYQQNVAVGIVSNVIVEPVNKVLVPKAALNEIHTSSSPMVRTSSSPMVRTSSSPMVPKTATSHILVFAPHKSGSVIMGAIWERACRFLQLCFMTDSDCRDAEPLCQKVHAPGQARPGTDGYPDCATPLFEALTDRHHKVTSWTIEDSVFVMAPVRNYSLSSSLDGLERKMLQIFHHRHPFDMICSAYSSFSKVHEKPPGITESDFQSMQQELQATGLEMFAMQQIYLILPFFKQACQSRRALHSVWFSRYETMVTNFTLYVNQLANALQTFGYLDAAKVRFFEEWLNRLQKVEFYRFQPDGHHKQSPQPGRHKKELKARQLRQLREIVTSNLSPGELDCLCNTMGYNDFCGNLPEG